MAPRRIYEKSLIIAPKVRQRELLGFKRENPEAEFALTDKENFVLWDAYRYDSRAEIALLKKGYPLSAVKEILPVLSRFNENKDYQDEKLKALKPVFEELRSLGFLFKDYMPSKLFDGRHILISGYSSTKRIGQALEEVKNLDTGFDLLHRNNPLPDVYEHEELIGECHHVCLRIAALLEKGISPNDIYLANYSHSYYFCLRLFSEYYGFSIDFPSSTPLSSTYLGRDFLRLYRETGGLEDALANLFEVYGTDPDFDTVSLLAKTYLIPEFGLDKQLALYQDLLSFKKRKEPKISPAVRILEGEYAKENSHVFYLDFSLETSPKTPQNPSYFSENALIEVGFPSLIERKKENEVELKGLLSQKEVEYVSYHLRHYDDLSHASPLIHEFEMKVLRPEEPSIEYSRLFALLKGKAMEDKKKRYGMDDPYLPFYSFDIPEYSNGFLLETTPEFSYPDHYSQSALDKYFKCPFAYYLDYILDLKRGDSPFSTRVGTIAHTLLEDIYDDDFDFDASFRKAIEDNEEKEGKLTSRELALLKVAKKNLKVFVDYVLRHEADIVNPVVEKELPLTADLGDIHLYGKADKIITFGERGQYYALVDYKTYGKVFDAELLPYGFDLQLPVYALLLKKNPLFDEKTLAGLYISQIIFSKDLRKNPKSDTNLRLEGIMLDDLSAINDFVGTFDTQGYVQGLTSSSKGIKASRAHPQEAIDLIVEEATKKIKEAYDDIHKNDFDISPAKMPSKKIDGCQYCNRREICFVKFADFHFLEEYTDEEEEDGDE